MSPRSDAERLQRRKAQNRQAQQTHRQKKAKQLDTANAENFTLKKLVEEFAEAIDRRDIGKASQILENARSNSPISTILAPERLSNPETIKSWRVHSFSPLSSSLISIMAPKDANQIVTPNENSTASLGSTVAAVDFALTGLDGGESNDESDELLPPLFPTLEMTDSRLHDLEQSRAHPRSIASNNLSSEDDEDICVINQATTKADSSEIYMSYDYLPTDSLISRGSRDNSPLDIVSPPAYHVENSRVKLIDSIPSRPRMDGIMQTLESQFPVSLDREPTRPDLFNCYDWQEFHQPVDPIVSIDNQLLVQHSLLNQRPFSAPDVASRYLNIPWTACHPSCQTSVNSGYYPTQYELFPSLMSPLEYPIYHNSFPVHNWAPAAQPFGLQH